MCNISKQESNRIANIGFICAVLVVMIHCPSADTAGIRFFRGVFPGCFMSIVNAWFFMVAGFFFVGSYGKEKWWKHAIVKRLKTLVVPYISLNILFFVFQAFYQWPNVRYPVTADGSLLLHFVRAMGFTACNPIDGPLWFVRSLFLYMLITPLIMPLLDKKRTAVVLCLGLFCCNCLDVWSCGGKVIANIIRPQWIVFYAAGICFRQFGIPTLSRRVTIAMFALGVLLSMCVPMGRILITSPLVRSSFDWLNKPLIMLGVFMLMTDRPFPKILTSNSFAIYILHWQLIMLAHIAGDKLGCYDHVFGNPIYCILFIVCAVVAVVAVSQVCKKSKLLSTLMFGGRVQ